MRCSVLNCPNRTKDSNKIKQEVSFHKFPKESSLKLEWMMRCNRQGSKWNPDASYICSEHFVSSDYNIIEPGGSTKDYGLKSWAIPSRNLPLLTLPVCLLERIDSEELKELTMKNPVKIGDLTVDELKAELKKRKVAQVGPKVALLKKLKKALTDEGEDPENYIFNKDEDKESAENTKSEGEESDSSKATSSNKGDTKKTPAPKSDLDDIKASDDTDTPKRTLRRSTRERSPAIQSAPTTPSKTPRTATKARTTTANKLTALTEEDESNSKEAKRETSDTKSEDGKDKSFTAKKETKKDVKKEEKAESKNNEAEDKETKQSKKEQEVEDSKDTAEDKDETEEKITLNGEKDKAESSKSPEKKVEAKEPESKKSLNKSINKDGEGDKDQAENEGTAGEDAAHEDMDDEEAKQAELDLNLDDMELPDYEEELNFDCGSTFISDNDADLDETDDGRKDSAKKQRKSSGKDRSDLKGSEGDNGEDGKDSEEDKEKRKTSDKKDSEKEDPRDSEKGADGKECSPKDLWVTGLSSATKAADLKQAFLKHGKVVSTKIVMNPKMPGSQCFGIVTVASQEDALACVKALNVTELLGRFITVKIIAKKKKDKKEDSPKRKNDESGKEVSEEKKEFSSPKKEAAKDGTKLPDEKDKKERDGRRSRESIRKRLGTHRVPIRRSPPPFVRRRQENIRQQEMMRRRELMEMRKRAMDRRMAEEAHRQEAVRLNREREMLRMERERIEREKVELLRMERERIEREKEEIRKQHMRLEEVRRKRDFGGPRDDFDSRPNKRPMNERYSDRRPSPAYGGGPPPYRDKDAREKRIKNVPPQPEAHLRKKKEGVKGHWESGSERKHMHKNSESKESWKSRGDNHKRSYEDSEKLGDSHQMQHLIQMKQKIKKELRMSQEEVEPTIQFKKRKHSRSPSGRVSGSHYSHQGSNIPSRKSKPSSTPSSPPPQHRQSSNSSKSSKHRRDDRSGRFDNRDRYEGGDRRHEGWQREDNRGGWGGDKGNNEQWAQPQPTSHDRHWNNSSGNKGRGGYGNNSNSSRGGNQSQGYNRGGPQNNMAGPGGNMNPYPPPQQHNFNPYPPTKF